MTILDFEPVSLSHKEIVTTFYKENLLENSEYTFTNIFIWGGNGKIKLAFNGDSLFFLLHHGIGKPIMFAPLTRSGGDFERAYALAFEYLKGIGAVPMLNSVCDSIKKKFELMPQKYELLDDRNNYDYVYLADDLVSLVGRRYHAKRNHINKFNYNYEYVNLHSFDIDECMAVYDEWLKGKDVFTPYVMNEHDAIVRAIENATALGVTMGGIKIDKRLVAFTIGESISDDSALIHIEKAIDGYEGLFTVINRDFLSHEFSNKLYINREEDMGLEGLRKAKLSYYPHHFIEKYIVKELEQ